MSNELDAVAGTLRCWVERHDALERAKQHFYKVLEGYQHGEKAGIPAFKTILRDSFAIEALHVSYVMTWPDGEFCYVVVSIPHKYQQKIFGRYRVFFDLLGAVWDDSWYFDEEFVQKILASQQEERTFLGEPGHE